MRADIRGDQLTISDALRTHIERRLHFALSRFGARIPHVAVRLEEINGPRGGVDKRCRIVVALAGAGHVDVEVLDSECTSAVDRAADRIHRVVAREFDRQHGGSDSHARSTRIPAAMFFRRQRRADIVNTFSQGGLLS